MTEQQPKFITSRAYGPKYKASACEIMEYLGLKPTQHLPKEGMPWREIQGFRVMVLPLPDRPMPEPGRRWHKRSKHRVIAECPTCKQILSVGRLHQHKCDD